MKTPISSLHDCAVSEHRCLSCGMTLDAAASPFGEHDPEPGDITVCGYCGHVMAFAHDMMPRELTDEEILDLAGDERILAIQHFRAAIERKQK